MDFTGGSSSDGSTGLPFGSADDDSKKKVSESIHSPVLACH